MPTHASALFRKHDSFAYRPCIWRHQLDLQIFGSLGQLAYPEVTEGKLCKWKWFSQLLRLYNSHCFFPRGDYLYIHSLIFQPRDNYNAPTPKITSPNRKPQLDPYHTSLMFVLFCFWHWLCYVSISFNKHCFKMLHTPIKEVSHYTSTWQAPIHTSYTTATLLPLFQGSSSTRVQWTSL